MAQIFRARAYKNEMKLKNPKYPLKKNRPGSPGKGHASGRSHHRPDGKWSWGTGEMTWRQDATTTVLTGSRIDDTGKWTGVRTGKLPSWPAQKSHRQEVRPDGTPDDQRAGKWPLCLRVRTRPLPSWRELEIAYASGRAHYRPDGNWKLPQNKKEINTWWMGTSLNPNTTQTSTKQHNNITHKCSNHIHAQVYKIKT